MTTKLKWRLSKLPDSHEVTLLVEKGILKKEEAREILFSLETDEDRDNKSLQEEIKFLRALAEKLALNGQNISRTIEVVKVPYYTQPWFTPYAVYCNSIGDIVSTGYTSGTQTALSNQALLTTTGSNTVTYSYSSEPSFSEISTF